MRFASWSLTRRLVVGIVSLLAVVSIAIGALSAAVLRSVLLARLDDQVSAASAVFVGPDGYPEQQQPSPGDARRPGALLLIATDGSVDAASFLAENLTAVPLTEDQRRLLLDQVTSTEATTVGLGEGLGRYRVAATVVGTSPAGLVIVGLPQREVDDTIAELGLIIAIVTLVALVATAASGTAVVRVALRPLGRVAATATRVSELPLDKGEVTLAERVPDADTDERTEVGQVGSAINRMLGHVESALSSREASEQKVRRFVADASHELRTPLAAIRGYAELTRRGGHELPDDVVHSIGRVESEAVRMTSLVEDLLLLARLDEGRDLELQAVDLSRILVDSIRDAHVAGPDHAFSLDIPDDPVIVRGDDPRLRQVFANLLANARIHTAAGTTVQAALRVEDDDAQVTIIDDGGGIPADLVPELFERFARGDSSRSRLAGSTGLGLAIVRAIVTAHHGTVDVSSRQGSTVFTVRVPRHAGDPARLDGTKETP